MTWQEDLIANAPDSAIAHKIASALECLLHCPDDFLLKVNANERSITHRLAVHLGSVFQGWHVDCEYNRDGHDPENWKRLLLSPECTSRANSDEGSQVYPDIIVHRRGSQCNLLVIEAKNSTNRTPRNCDLEKLQEYKKQLHYKYALFVEFLTKTTQPGIKCTEWI